MTLPCLYPLLVCGRPGTRRPAKGGSAGAGSLLQAPRGAWAPPLVTSSCARRAGLGGGSAPEQPRRELGQGEDRAERLSLPAARAGNGWLSLLRSLCFSLWSPLAPVGQATLGSGRGRAAACDKCDSLAMASPFTVTVCFCLLVQ